ncbi:MAG TPA: hypothetical protein VFC44_26885 [Candidatus Saccharimonadales bacterium]|nr:hypothetical protein [Candidatus Saccharimonadales bacterium]
MSDFEYFRLFALRTWLRVMAGVGFLLTGSPALAQTDSATQTYSTTNAAASAVTQNDSTSKTPDDSRAHTSLGKELLDLQLGPFALHPRLVAGAIYDDNILLSVANKEADLEWTVQPALQAVAGDDAALLAYRDLNYDVLGLSPGGLIVQQPELWPGKFLLIDYGPRFQLFDKYTANNSIDELGTLNLLWPMHKLIVGFKQDYRLEKTEIIEFDQRATVETISSALSAAYQLGDATSIESNFRRISVGYNQAGLTGYTEYNTEDWFNYQLKENVPISLGVLAGEDVVADRQDQTYEQLRVRARYSYTEKLAFDASGGGELRQYQNGNSATLSPVFTIAGEYRPTERSTVRLSGFRQQYASIFNGYNYSTTGASLEGRQGITDRFTAALSVGYYSIDYTPISRGVSSSTGDYYIARISLEAKIIRHLNGQIYYQLLSSQSQVGGGGVTDNQTGVQLTLGF